MYNAIFPICYCPPISWFAAACQESAILLEGMAPYQKQAYTNRMHIRVSNKVMALSIPVERRNRHVPIKEKRISYQENWQRHHQRSIHFAYQNSPNYPYYMDHFVPFYEQKYEWLIDYTYEWIGCLFQLLKKDIQLGVTDIFEEKTKMEHDYRQDFDPTRKTHAAWFRSEPYTQVFEGFEENLSIVDLLCNEGPQSISMLKGMFSR